MAGNIFDNMKGIDIASAFKLQSEQPLDLRSVVATSDDLSKLVAEHGAYEGMPVYVTAEHSRYIYTNNSWKKETFENKTVLDGISSTSVSNWNTAFTNSHTHSNKGALDALSVDADNNMTINCLSAAFTGTLTAPTAAEGTNTTQVATTEFVKSALDKLQRIYETTPVRIGTWPGGTPVWRMIVKHFLTAEQANEKKVGITGLLPVIDKNAVFLSDFCVFAVQSGRNIQDDFQCSVELGAFDFTESGRTYCATVDAIEGYVEFVTAENNIILETNT